MKILPCLFIALTIFSTGVTRSQSLPPLLPAAKDAGPVLQKISSDPAINADSAAKLLAHWNAYPEIKKTGRDYKFFYNNPVFGKIPFRIYIPKNYKSTQASPAILLLHGAAGRSQFSDIDSTNRPDDIEVFVGLRSQDYIVIRPLASKWVKFSWVVNEFKGGPNLTYSALNQALAAIKQVLNIDDDRVYAFGHSDGSDGAIGLGIYVPDAFAGGVAYNSMLTNIFAYDYYIRNIRNRPIYLVHSDLDAIRPIEQTREILNELKKQGDTINYKEYIGYRHFDKHLTMDLPNAIAFMQKLKRNTFLNKIYLETDTTNYSICAWLNIIKTNTGAPAAAWHKRFDTRAYDKRINAFMTGITAYPGLHKSAAVKASYSNNHFDIQTSEVEEVEVKISPQMVDMKKPVSISVNGKPVYSGIAVADKQYLVNGFKKMFDRQALWVGSIKVKTGI